MTHDEMRDHIGIKRINYIRPDYMVFELNGGGARPATDLEMRMIRLLDIIYKDD